MLGLMWYQYALISVTFAWSGFVRTGLGFGGALFTLPFLLLIDNQPIVYLSLIAVQLLFFSVLTFVQNYYKPPKAERQPPLSNVDWPYLRKMLSIVIVPKLIGVFGLLTLPGNLMSIIIFGIVVFYACTYIVNRPLRATNRWVETVFLMMGGYISGTSLIGAPLIVAVATRHIATKQLRDTLFVLWFIFVTIKVSVLIYSGVDLHLINHLWLVPCAFVGHMLGLRAHDWLIQNQSGAFYRVIGCSLLAASAVGLTQALL